MDNTINTKEDLKAIYRALPPELQEIIFAPETSAAYDALKEKYQLNAGQRELLSINTGLLLMGFVLPQELVPTLAQQLGSPREVAASIAQDLNRDIFVNIKDALKEWNAEVEEAALSVSVSATRPKPHIPEPPRVVGEEVQKEVREEKKEAAPLPPIIPASASATPPPISVVVPAGASHPITFSMHKALGKAGVEEPSAPKEKEGAGNILEQKLGGAFRMKSNAVHYAVPHKPKIPAPAPRRIPAPSTGAATSGDPYREAA